MPEIGSTRGEKAMTKLDPETLALFSPQVRKILGRASRERPPARSAIIRRLKEVGRPVFDAVLDFEQRLGGLHLHLGVLGSKQTFELGIAWHPPRPDPDDPDDPERTMVPVGSGWNGYEYLYMSEQGEITCHFDTVIMKSSSIVHYLEQRVITLVPRWKRPRFGVDLSPALGASLAEALGLHVVEEASDPYVAWWMGPGIAIQQVFFEGAWKADQTNVYARSIADVARTLEAAGTIRTELLADVESDPFERKRLTKKQRAKAPTIESWASTSGAQRYRFGSEDAHLTGVVWVLPERDGCRIEQYRVYVDEDEEKLLAWDTFTASGGISRDMEE